MVKDVSQVSLVYLLSLLPNEKSLEFSRLSDLWTRSCCDVASDDTGKGFDIETLYVDFSSASEGVDDSFTCSDRLHEAIFQMDIVVQFAAPSHHMSIVNGDCATV